MHCLNRICNEGFNHHNMRNWHEKKHKEGTQEMASRSSKRFIRPKKTYDESLRQEDSVATCELCGKQWKGKTCFFIARLCVL